MKHMCIGDCSPDLCAISYYSLIGHQSLDIFVVIGKDCIAVKIVESLSESLPFIEYTLPRQPGLKTFKRQQFEQFCVIMHRTAPFIVMVPYVQRIFRICPMASFLFHFSDKYNHFSNP